ncbi:MAG: hypothetical protein ACR2PL_06210 [Dehalococcoidia bacterium]
MPLPLAVAIFAVSLALSVVSSLAPGFHSVPGQTVSAVWWLVGMTALARVLPSLGGSLSRFDPALSIALYLMFAALIDAHASVILR